MNKTYNRLTIKEYVEEKNGKHYFKCICECGGVKVIDLYYLKSGGVKSCGCLRNEKLKLAVSQCFQDDANLGALKRGIQNNNKTGVKGVCYDRTKGKYHAYIGYKKKQIKLGYFDTLYEATQARKQAEEKYHKPILEEKRN